MLRTQAVTPVSDEWSPITRWLVSGHVVGMISISFSSLLDWGPSWLILVRFYCLSMETFPFRPMGFGWLEGFSPVAIFHLGRLPVVVPHLMILALHCTIPRLSSTNSGEEPRSPCGMWILSHSVPATVPSTQNVSSRAFLSVCAPEEKVVSAE